MTNANQRRLLHLFASTCAWRKVTPTMVESWTVSGLVEEVPGSIDPSRTLAGEAYRLFRMTPKGQSLIAK